MAITTARINSIFKAFGIDLAAHAEAQGETAAEALARMSEQHSQDSLVASLLRKYPENADAFVKGLFDSRSLDIAKGEETEQERIARIVSELKTGRTFTDLQQSLDRLAGTTSPPSAPGETPTGGGTTTGSGTSPPVGALGVMPGGRLMRIDRTGGESVYMQVYEWPAGSGKFMAWEYDNVAQVEQVFGADWATKQLPQVHTYDWVKKNVNIVDMADEVIGLAQPFGVFMQDTLRNAAIAGGINDPTLYGKFVADPEVQNILAQSALGGWSDLQQRAALRNTSFYQNDLYPGISNFYGEADPETAYRQYMANVETSLELLGVDKVDGSYRQVVGDMLDQGISDEVFVEMSSTFIRAQQSPQFAEILNQWTVNKLGRPLDFDTWFDVLAGQAPADVALVAESATLAYAASQQGVDVSAGQIQAIAEQSDLSDAAAAQAFNTYAQGLTALGERGLSKYSLTREEILAAAAGIKPSSGRSIEEVQRLTRQAAEEEGVLDDPKLQFFVGYDPNRGTPNRPGLNPLAPESA